MKDEKESNSQNTKNNKEQNEKIKQLEAEQSLLDDPENGFLTTDQGLPVANNQDHLTAGERGPTLMEDHIFREKMTRFDYERIPERVVHARGSAAHGYF
jgi:catalase